MPIEKGGNVLTSRFDRALVYAHEAHRDQIRKSSAIPYVSHLLAVASLVLEDGGDEDEAIAALLHDSVEDQGGTDRLEDCPRQVRKTRSGDRRFVLGYGRTAETSVAQPKRTLLDAPARRRYFGAAGLSGRQGA